MSAMQKTLKNIRLIKVARLTTVLCCLLAASLAMGSFSAGSVHSDKKTLQAPYTGGETLRYMVTWLGMEAGEIFIQVTRNSSESGQFLITATARSAGLLDFFYPVEDYFETVVREKSRLPEYYKMLQKEGKRQNNKVTRYDQENYHVTYRKNDKSPELFKVDGPMHNEFSSFLFLRTLSFSSEAEEMMPIFADKQRHEVLVTVEGRESLPTILGQKNVLQIRPHLTFKGLYEKVDDPVIWLTDDAYRIPVQIKTKIVIGSLLAELVEYQGYPADS